MQSLMKFLTLISIFMVPNTYAMQQLDSTCKQLYKPSHFYDLICSNFSSILHKKKKQMLQNQEQMEAEYRKILPTLADEMSGNRYSSRWTGSRFIREECPLQQDKKNRWQRLWLRNAGQDFKVTQVSTRHPNMKAAEDQANEYWKNYNADLEVIEQCTAKTMDNQVEMWEKRAATREDQTRKTKDELIYDARIYQAVLESMHSKHAREISDLTAKYMLSYPTEKKQEIDELLRKKKRLEFALKSIRSTTTPYHQPAEKFQPRVDPLDDMPSITLNTKPEWLGYKMQNF